MIRDDFPTLKRIIHGKPLVYLDSTATSLKPYSVIETISDFYANHNANVHRGVYVLSQEATDLYEGAREKIKGFFSVPDEGEIVFTRGTTEAINLVVSSWARRELNRNDVIVLSEMEHHSNMVPWQLVSEETGAVIKYIPILQDGSLDMDFYREVLAEGNVKIVAVNHISNVLGTLNPVEEIVKIAHSYNALVLIDGAQSAPHIPLNLKALGADFYAVSSHKMLGPTGIGFLYAKRDLLENMAPYQAGGDMIMEVCFDRASWNDIPYKFEAGTQNIAGVVGFGAAVDYLSSVGMDFVAEHSHNLARLARERLLSINGVTVYGPKDCSPGGIVSFNIEGAHPHDVGTILDTEGIAVRTGHHCAQPLMGVLGVAATVRASFYLYNTEDDIESLYRGILKVREVLKIGT